MYVFDIDFQDLFPCQNKAMRFGIVAADADEALELAKYWYGLDIKSASRSRTLSRSIPQETMCEYHVAYVLGETRHDIRLVGGITAIGVVIQQLVNINGLVLGMWRVSTFRNLQRPVQSNKRVAIVTHD